jgi:hypothetical protein
MEGGKKQAATWFYKAADGQYETRLRYGQSAIPLEGGKEGVRVGKLEDLIPFYDSVVKAIEAGELAALCGRPQKGQALFTLPERVL